METKKWLAKSLDIDEQNIEELYENPIGLDFLLVWTRFEVVNFDGFVTITGKERGQKVRKSFDEFSEEKKSYFSSSLSPIFDIFYDRYQDKNKLKNLCNQKKCNVVKCNFFNACKSRKIIDKTKRVISDKEKLYFLTYVIYRYRNNMFHGSKGFNNWITQYKDQINDCIKVMMELTELPNMGGDSNVAE